MHLADVLHLSHFKNIYTYIYSILRLGDNKPYTEAFNIILRLLILSSVLFDASFTDFVTYLIKHSLDQRVPKPLLNILLKFSLITLVHVAAALATEDRSQIKIAPLVNRYSFYIYIYMSLSEVFVGYILNNF